MDLFLDIFHLSGKTAHSQLKRNMNFVHFSSHTYSLFVYTILNIAVAMVTSQGTLTEDSIVITNSGIVVPLGRSVYLTPDDLHIRVRPGDMCVVSVLDNDPLAQRPGRLTPPTFPCKFGPQEVLYSHYGARNPLEDFIRLQIRYDTDTQTIFIPATIHVEVSFDQLEVVVLNLPLTVDRLLGVSTPISSEILKFEYIRGSEQCRLTVLPKAHGLPRYGIVANDSSVLQMVDCDEFLKLGVRYQHTAATNSPNKDYLPLVVEVIDPEGRISKKEYFQIRVNILDGKKNEKPSIDFDAKLNLEVNQFVMTAVTPDVLRAEDVETPLDLLIFNITKPLKQGEGYFVSTDDRNQVITSFYQRDVRDLKIAYKPPPEDSDLPRNFAVEMQVIDTDGEASESFVLSILVKPMNTLAPVVTTNRGIQLLEGQSRALQINSNLQVSDENNLEKVQIFVEAGLRHGQLRIPGGRKYFTPADLRSGSVVYQHDHSDTHSDNIIFKMTDGQNVVEFLFPIWVFPVDDQAPILNANIGLVISKNQLVEISPFILSASDSDSDDAVIRFVLEPSNSQEGVIVKRQFHVPDDPSQWEHVDGAYEQIVNEFTQGDILDGVVFYRHIGPHRSDIYLDRIKLRVVDSGSPPNYSDLKEFVVTVVPVDDQLPYLYPNTSLRMEVSEFQQTDFKRKVIRYTDDDTDDREIRYRVTTFPFDTDSNTAMSTGIITFCEGPDVNVSTFTQAQINHRKICYRPPSEELGIVPRIIQFFYDVEDTNGNILRDEKFTILLRPINNHPPVVKNGGVSVVEGGFSILTSDMLNVEDPDTDEDGVMFIVMEVPEHGQIRRKGEILQVQDMFTIADIQGRNIAYFNNGEEIGDDKFLMEVSDGVHRIPVKFNVHIKSVDDEKPALVGAKLDTLKIVLEVLENSAVPLSSETIRATDKDSNDMLIRFMVERAPYEGIIMRGTEQSTHFTQADIVAGRVIYQHSGGEVGLAGRDDYFELSLLDPNKEVVVEGSHIDKVLVEVKILPNDNEPPIVTIGASFDVLESQKAPILTRHLDATDIDTEDGDITCLITSQPQSGYVENTSPAAGSERSRAGKPVSAFTIRDIRSGVINYVQSLHKGIEPRKDSFMFHCSDGINKSPDFNFDIKIAPFNDEEPEIYLREFIVVEGGRLSIDLPILNVIDRDIPANELIFIITEQPKHGKIIRQTSDDSFSVQDFTLDDISGQSTITYEHDDSETVEDSFSFYVLDGAHNISKTVPINLLPLDDETPRLTINNGLQLDKAGDNRTITNKVLKAEDLDSNNADLIFMVQLKPTFGYLLKVDGEISTNITQGGNFTQRDIDRRRIVYVHTGKGGERDLIKFNVSDGLNDLIDRYFYITIEGIDNLFPKVINKGVELPEGGMAVLTTDLLSGTDLNSPDETLSFTITRAPSRGQLESSDTPGVPISTFTQLQLAGNKIRYVHSSGDEMKMDSFEFKVSDGSNHVTRTFRIFLSDVDNRKPLIMFQTLHLKEGGNKLITPFELRADDRDTTPAKIVFTITQVPSHGFLLHNNSRVVTSFSMADLNENLITYQHDGSETADDSFSFTVTDGTHTDFIVAPATDILTRKPQTMNILISPVDNGIPRISINRGASYLAELAGNHIGFRITNRILSTEDRDSPDDNLLYSLTSAPKWGYVINRAIGNRSITNWTQGDINRQQIEYILRPGVNATTDSFFFTVSDKGGNVLANQPFHLNWAWISMESDVFIVNETKATLNVTLRRRGYLGETAFVTIMALNGSAKSGEDFTARYAKQVQFNPGQTEKTWRLRLIDDDRFEESETFELRLSDPVMAVIEYPDVAHVTIEDYEDESQVFFSDTEYRVAEDIGEILIPIKRVGDISDETMVMCSTVQGSANGTVPNTVTSFSDYITRPADHRSMVRFDKGDQEKFCRVMIIDDSLCEKEEKFTVVLSEPMGGQIGKSDYVDVVIEPDSNDEPIIYMGSSSYVVDESDGFVEVKVWRTGTDMNTPSSVTVRSRKSDPKSADAGLDYVAVNAVLDFAPGVTLQTVKVVILDDLGRPRLEGDETFLLILRMPTNAVLGEPKEAVITINDSFSDLPRMEFKETSYRVKENDGEARAVVVRSGDLSHESSVRCYTRQGTARVELDYQERPDTSESLIVFQPGEYAKECVVKIVDDALFEDHEQFRLVLGSAEGPHLGAANIGKHNSTIVTIEDDGDQPVIKLSDTKYTVKEPMFREEVATLTIPVLRDGDLSETAIVTINTKDGSADAGKDYNGFFKELVFGANMSRVEVLVNILYDGQKEMREVFTVHLKSRSGTAKIENPKAFIYIEERTKVADVTFPDKPMVVSLRDYDRADEAEKQPVQGYPLVCLTTCNPRHPNYSKTGGLCETEGINNEKTLFRWRVSAPSRQDGVSSDLQDVESNTFFATTRAITLDSIYFAAGSRVQCGSRAVNLEGEPGLEVLSETVVVNPDKGICEPREMDSVGAEPFTARMRYTGPSDPHHPNKVRLTITIPHRDGMMPVISTQQLSNFELTLSKDGLRLASHKCSNLLAFNEVKTKFGFLTNETRNDNIIGEAEPYQFSSKMRSEPTLQFYRNLDLESCLWEFESYFDMSELVTECGGQITTDGQVLNVKQSYVSVRVPLFVSYVFHSPVARGGWLHYDMRSNLQLSFVYDTSILWQNGISSPEGKSGLQGFLYPTSMRISEDGRLVVAFRTEARFKGQFVATYPGSTLESEVYSVDHPDLTFKLELVHIDPTFDQPGQEWTFVSEFAARDYSGKFNIKLVPCTTSLDQDFAQPISCTPRDPLNFDLVIRFQQVSDPVPAKFSLNTEFSLMRKKELWLAETDTAQGEETDAAFLPTDKIYGRISVDPVQSLGNSFDLNVEKVFLCSGKDGYIPKYNPGNQEFGCVAESPNLQYSFKILDKGAPFTVADKFRDIPFKATLASEDPEAVQLVRQPGADGFFLDCQPLFQVDTGRQWFLHAIYTVRSQQNSGRGIGKRSVINEQQPQNYHVMVSALRKKRSQDDATGVGEEGKGTNIARIQLDYLKVNGGDIELDTSISTTGNIPLILILISLIVLLFVSLLLIIFLVRRRKKSTSPPISPTNTITVVQNRNSSRVITTRHYHNDNHTEV